MQSDATLTFEEAPAALLDFSEIDVLYGLLRSQPNKTKYAAWFVYGGLARYFLGNFAGAIGDCDQLTFFRLQGSPVPKTYLDT